MRFFRRLKAIIRKVRSDLFSKRHKCISYKQYLWKYDKGRNIRATKLRDYYPGYPYVYIFQDSFWFTSLEYKEIRKWCDDNLRYKYR